MKKQTTAREDRLFQICRAVSHTGQIPRREMALAMSPRLTQQERASIAMIKPAIANGMAFYVEQEVARTGAVPQELKRKIRHAFTFLMKHSTAKQQADIKGLPVGWVQAGKQRHAVYLPPGPGIAGRLRGCGCG